MEDSQYARLELAREAASAALLAFSQEAIKFTAAHPGQWFYALDMCKALVQICSDAMIDIDKYTDAHRFFSYFFCGRFPCMNSKPAFFGRFMRV